MKKISRSVFTVSIALLINLNSHAEPLKGSIASPIKQVIADIRQRDKGEFATNSILLVNDALAESVATQSFTNTGLLSGLPIVIKDNIETLDMPTTAGSLALANNSTGRDAPIVTALRQQGAVIIAKSNLSEWANFRSESSISGWSSAGGLTRNAHNLSRTACGSSSGSAVAVAAGFVELAIGTETNGSIICPASMNGVVGFKPTVGLLSAQHIVPISPSQDTAGPITQTVAQAALLTGIMAQQEHIELGRSLIAFCNQPSTEIKGKRLGVIRNRLSKVDAVNALFETHLKVLSDKGAIVVDIEIPEIDKSFWDDSYQVLLSEFHPALNAYLQNSPADIPVRSLKDVIAFNRAHPDTLSAFDQSIFDLSLQAAALDSEKYKNALAHVQRVTREEGIDAVMDEYQLDALVAPSNNPAFLIDGVYGDHSPKGRVGIGWMAAIAGYPHLSVPMGKVKAMPIGISFIAGKYQDAHLFAFGQAIEEARTEDMTPQFMVRDAL